MPNLTEAQVQKVAEFAALAQVAGAEVGIRCALEGGYTLYVATLDKATSVYLWRRVAETKTSADTAYKPLWTECERDISTVLSSEQAKVSVYFSLVLLPDMVVL